MSSKFKRRAIIPHNSREQFQVHQPGSNGSERVKLMDPTRPYDPLADYLAQHPSRRATAAQRPTASPGPDYREAHKLDLERRRLDRKP